MDIGPLPYFLHDEEVPLVGCSLMWDFMFVGQVFSKPLCGISCLWVKYSLSPFLVMWLELYWQETQTHTWNKYLLNTREDQLLALSRGSNASGQLVI